MLQKLTYKLISQIGVQEKYIRKEHYNSLKVWWARRPITAMRSLLLLETLRRHNEKTANIENALFSELNPDRKHFEEFRDKYKTDQFSVLDVFAGGGSIPFESARLGYKTYASELNPVASLLQETIFNSLGIENFGSKVKKAGYNIVDRVEKRLLKYYQIGGTEPYVIFWAKIAKCKSCGGLLDLRRLEYLSKRKSRPVRIIGQFQKLELSKTFGEETKLAKEFTCATCGTANSFKDIRDYCKTQKFTHHPFAFCETIGGKKYRLTNSSDIEALSEYSVAINKDLKTLDYLLPKGELKVKGGVINPTLYDLKKPHDFFNERQLLVLLTVIEEIKNEYTLLTGLYKNDEAKQVVLALTAMIEFLVDWNSVSTMWISQNEQTGRSLAGPGVGMKWDYIEINPFCKTGSNLRSKIDRIAETYNALKLDQKVSIIKGSSTSLPLEDSSIDIVLTDPPYYDSIDYTGLSEFFRPWFEILVSETFDKKIDLKNQDDFEAIVELTSNSKKDHNHYQTIMTDVLTEVNRVLKPNGTAMMLYSHKTFEGWKVIADSFIDSGLFVCECIPLEMERIARPRAMSYDALNGVITFRLSKTKDGIKPIDSDILDLRAMILAGELLDSQVVIYLAGLAVKLVSLTKTTYEFAYDQVIKTYEKLRLESWINGKMDLITKSYLEAKLNGSLKGLDNSYSEVLKSNDLVIESRIKNLDEILLSEKTKNTILESAVIIYKNFKDNSKTKVVFADQEKESLIAFYSIIGGTELNSVAKRSSSEESKVARLVLAKVS